MKIIPVIIAGGEGSRLWPLSKKGLSKPFIKLFDKTFYQEALLKFSDKKFSEVLNVINKENIWTCLNNAQEINFNKKLVFILESQRKNTAPAVINAALNYYEKSKSEDIYLHVIPADHLIEDKQKFLKMLNLGLNKAKQGKIVTYGIRPDSANCNYGYISTINKKVKFHEKPPQSVAKKYFESGKYFWNSGIFTFSVKIFFNEIGKLYPNLFNSLFSGKNYTKEVEIFNSKIFSLSDEHQNKFNNISIDHFLMEKTDNLSMLPVDFKWRDIGSWDSFDEIIQKDQNGNSLSEKVIFSESKNSSIINFDNDETTFLAVGINNQCLIKSNNSILILNKKSTKSLKNIYQNIITTNNNFNESKTIYRPWGFFKVIYENQLFKIKLITVLPDQCISLQYHKYRSEHWIVLEGEANVTRDNEIFDIKKNESTFIKKNQIHKIYNKKKKNLVFLELQTGSCLEENDIFRIKDQYERFE